jgi:hypothetical protein
VKKNISQKIAIAIAFFIAFLSPVYVGAATSTANTIVNATVNSVITISTATPIAISLTPAFVGGVVSSASDTVTVSTNNALGYTLTLANADANTSLVNGANNITAHTGTQASPTALGNNTWGYRIVSVGGFGAGAYSAETDNASSSSTWAGVPSNASPNTIKTTSSTATGDTTTVWYGVKVNTSIPNGVYTDTVTYTATTN